MLILALVFLIQPDFAQQQQIIKQPQLIRSLSGQLDQTPVFNSNSPEIVQTDGILLSTFPSDHKKYPEAHLNYAFNGYFDIFLHHINNAVLSHDNRPIFIGVIVNNPSLQPVKIKIMQAATYVSQPDAPFIGLPDFEDNPDGKIFAGPGDRVTDDVLRGVRQSLFPKQITLAPGQTKLLFNVPISVSDLQPPINGRTVLIRAKSNGPVYLAALAKHADTKYGAIPQLADYMDILQSYALAGPREKPPSLPNSTAQVIYGRSSGVSAGSCYKAILVDDSLKTLQIPEEGKSYSYVIDSVEQGTFGTNQVQSAHFIVRYPDTAYAAHGNYGVEYDLCLPLYNSSTQPQKVSLAIQTPIKNNEPANSLSFKSETAGPAFFRGTVKIFCSGQKGPKYIHLVQKQGQRGKPLIILRLKPKSLQKVTINFLYPPDSTPPQVLTINTAAQNSKKD